MSRWSLFLGNFIRAFRNGFFDQFVEGKSRREAAQVFGLSRETISKMCRFSAPPGYVRSKAPERPKLGPLIPVICRWPLARCAVDNAMCLSPNTELYYTKDIRTDRQIFN
jgi:hypothetical protein